MNLMRFTDFSVGMSVTKAAKRILRKDIKKTIALITPEQKKCQSDIVTEKVSEFQSAILGKHMTTYFSYSESLPWLQTFSTVVCTSVNSPRDEFNFENKCNVLLKSR
jgi:hypothetical protein